MAAYFPNSPPPDQSQLVAYLVQELQRISQASVQPSESIMLQTIYAPPKKLRDGMVVLADGTTWNPGSGAGYYGYLGGAWKFLG